MPGSERAPGRALGLALLLALCGACGERVGESPSQVPLPLERERTLGPFLSEHWRVPLAPQGKPPPDFTEAEHSLDPAVCGACHAKQYAEWQTTLHANAFSPGFAGQLIEGELAQPAELRACQACHAPLAEQQPYAQDLQPNALLDLRLRSHGITCAGCHVRAHRRFGPPRRSELPPLPEPVPHAGFEARSEYLESRFCAECHQFFGDPGVNGKPLENTFAEWQRSPQAAAGRHCQDCHMPDRAHLWRGIHDAEAVRAAVDVDLVPSDLSSAQLSAALVLRNRDVGHAFPSYVTPRVFLSIHQIDASGRELDGTREQGVIGREVDLAIGVERFDTRVLPGESVRLDYARPRAPGAVALLGRAVVDPDYHYRGVFEFLLPTLTDATARTLIAEASRRVAQSAYTLAEIRRPLPR